MQKMKEMWVPSLGWGGEDPLEKEMATHPSILAWKIPWTEEPGGLQSMELQKESDMTEHTCTAKRSLLGCLLRLHFQRLLFKTKPHYPSPTPPRKQQLNKQVSRSDDFSCLCQGSFSHRNLASKSSLVLVDLSYHELPPHCLLNLNGFFESSL